MCLVDVAALCKGPGLSPCLDLQGSGVACWGCSTVRMLRHKLWQGLQACCLDSSGV